MFAEKENQPQTRSNQSNGRQNPHVQTKLEIGAKDDPKEKEADEVADKVMRSGEKGEGGTAGGGDNNIRRSHEEDDDKVMTMRDESQAPVMTMKEENHSYSGTVMRVYEAPVMTMKAEPVQVWKKEEEEETEKPEASPGKLMKSADDEEEVHKKEDEEEIARKEDDEEVDKKEEEEEVHKKSEEKPLMMEADPGGSGGGTATPEFQSQLNSSKGNGSPLPDAVQNDIGPKMGQDLSNVRIHTDSKAHEMASGINAKAFTYGSDIYFKQGNYNPASDSGKRLLVHETHHTVQQTGGKVERKVQRGFWGNVWNKTKAVGNFIYENSGAKTVVETGKDIYHSIADTPEEFEKYMQAKLKGQIDSIKAQKEPSVQFTVNYWMMKGVAAAMNPLGFFMMPSTQAMWDVYKEGKIGYYTYLYNLGNEYIEKKNQETGKTETVRNEAYQEGGYAKVFKHQIENTLNPLMGVGEIVGIFKGIGLWFWDIIKMIGFLGEMFLGGIQNTWNMLVYQKPPKWMETIAKAGVSAGKWFYENGPGILEELGILMHDEKKLKAVIGDLKSALKTGASHMAYGMGEQVAAGQVGFMNKSAFEQGMDFGTIIGYLIPEIVIAFFSETIVNWIKGIIKAIQAFWETIRAFKAIVAVGKAAGWVVDACKGMWRVFRGTSGKLGGKLGKAFEDIMEFFKGIFKWGDEAKATDNVVDTATDLGKTDDLVTHADDAKGPKEEPKGPKDEPNSKKPKDEPDGDDTMRRAAFIAMVTEVAQSNATDEPLSKFKSDIRAIKTRFPIVKYFKFTRALDGGLNVFMKASPLVPGGHKKKPAVPELPSLDSTGKVHGDLPNPKDFGKYERHELEQLLDELELSVQERINTTTRKGPGASDLQNRTHGQRQAAEQRLIIDLKKYLSGK